jgi:hypothetical protein
MQSVNAGARLRTAIFGVFTGSLISVALFSTASKADFFDDLFGFDHPVARRADHYSGDRHQGPSGAVRLRARVRSAHVADDHRERSRRPQVASIRHDFDRREEAAGTAAATGSRPIKPAFCVREAAPARMSRFTQLLNDSTLRAGDIVVTATGVRVFHGGGACPHKARDFLALNGSGLPKGQLRMLAGLEVVTPGNFHELHR